MSIRISSMRSMKRMRAGCKESLGCFSRRARPRRAECHGSVRRSRTLLAQHLKDRLQFFSHVVQGFRQVFFRFLRLRVGNPYFAPAFLELLLRPGDREPLGIEELLDAQDRVDLTLRVE